MKISAIIVNYRTPDHVTALLPTLSNHQAVTDTLVIDNQPLEPFSTTLANVKIKTSDTNIGFGAAINLAIEDVSTDWVLLINPDVRLENGCLSALIDAAGRFGSPLLGPRFYWDHEHQFRLPPATGGSAWFNSALHCASKHRLERMLLTHHWSARHDRFWSLDEPFFEPFLSGACLLVDRSRLSHAPDKLMDPAFFLYFEDTDLCARALAGGYHPLCVPQAEAVHFWNQSPEPDMPKVTLSRESEIIYFRKHFEHHKSVEIPGPRLQTECQNLGPLSAPPVLDSDYLAESEYCELAVSEQFVPFAQASTPQRYFRISDAVWQHLAKGKYYLRARSIAQGVGHHWAFRKI